MRNNAVNFLETISCSPNLLPSEHRAASQLIRLLTREDLDAGRRHIEALLSPPHVCFFLIDSNMSISQRRNGVTLKLYNIGTTFLLLLATLQLISKDNIETLSALEIAEQMTYLDHQIFMNIRCE